MKSRKRSTSWAKLFERNLKTMTRMASTSTASTRRRASPLVAPSTLAPGGGTWTPGVAMGATGMRRFRIYRPPGIAFGERLPLMVMLHGCGQDANRFALSTKMNQLAARERFLVLYPEQDRIANGQGCWNWFATDNGRAYGEAALIMNAIDQACLLYPGDRTRVAVAGLSAGASMAALLVARHPERFKAVVMHSGIPPGTAHSGLSALGAMHGHRETPPLVAASWPPLLVVHGAADHVVSPQNGRAAARVWAEAADAQAGEVRRVQRGQRHPMQVTDFKRQGRTVATLVAVDRLAHAWSGGAAREPYSDGKGPDASRMAWAFASRQFRS
ncbi:PHB depolymerase family esterase [Hydrogenophaga sp.]|uniref:extracellular catalytic domain type 1 short-chain-length polyhydroxyalkanoate depolymerase n=1 Tax=Hydrogenophaga sp. TaxID=1904254 RepID=UPI00271F4FEC|nr:PHB depolymerase family esterase [Hydrogenophaga sp.]MDO8903808.1 PHB depolymerase family esterase [Hydrogenophaga sp.]